ncbi:MAG TPA: ABC transporter permease [Chryseosolibacter sp.]
MPTKKAQPPRLAKSILRRFCHVSFIEEVEGDLDEQFYENVQETGDHRAKMQYWIDVFRACISGNQAKEVDSQIGVRDSVNHFFKIFFRNLNRSRVSSFINIIGLVLSLTSFILVSLYVNDELTYDKFHPDAQNVYRISHSYGPPGNASGRQTDARVPGLWVEELQKSMQGVIACTRFSRFGYPGSVSYPKGNKLFEEQQFFWVDSTYTSIFNLPMIDGDARIALADPSKVIVSQTTARKYFGDKDPINEVIIYSRGGMDFPLTVAGVMRDYPSNVHFHPDFIVNNTALDPLWKRDGSDRVNSLGDPFTYSFIRLDNNQRVSEAMRILTSMLKKYNAEGVLPVLTKMTDIHFTKGMLIELETPSDRSYVYISASIGVLILIIAAINYMNLATARSARRSREVGLKKMLGVRRSSLAVHFLGESLVTVLMSFGISLASTSLLLPFFNQITGKSLTFASSFEDSVLVTLLLITFVLGVFSGCYPAFYLSRFKPAEVLKGKISTGKGAENFRRALVVFQFSVTMILIICATVIHNQLSFIQVGKLASHTDHVITIRTNGDVSTFRNAISKNKNVLDVSLSAHLPVQDNFGFMAREAMIKSKGDQKFIFDQISVDENFLTMFDLELIAGRNFSYTFPADTNNFIVNESVLKSLQLTPEEAIGQELSLKWAFEENVEPPFGKIIGVVKDFPYRSVRDKIAPLVMSGDHQHTQTMNVRIATETLNGTINDLEQTWKRMYDGYAFKYWFMDGEFERLYRQEKQIAKVSDYFTVFAIAIACLGLFGLAAFTVEQKVKELGIRKVLGASVRQLLQLITYKFVRLALIACVFAIPIGFYAMSVWLQGFAYKAPMEWWMFASAAMVVLLLTCLIVGIESFRAAVANPVDSIRHE